MKMRTMLTVGLALVFGLSAVYGVSALLAQSSDRGPAVETVGVVTITQDVPRFTALSDEMLKVKEFPKDLAPPGSSSRVEDVVGRVLDVPLVKEEAVLESKLVPKGAGRGMAAGIPKGMRAVTIQTANVASGVAGFVLPGNKVDVLFTHKSHRADDTTGGGSTRTLLENVEILAVNQRIDAPTDNKVDSKELKSVTLLVTPRQAAVVDLAQNSGTLHLTLRNPLDTEVNPTGEATLAGIQQQQIGKPLDVRLTELTSAGSKFLIDLRAAADRVDKLREKQPKDEVAVAPPPTVVTAPEPPPERLRIRTIRAGNPGLVYIE